MLHHHGALGDALEEGHFDIGARQQVDDRRGGFLHRAAGHVDDRPTVLGEQFSGFRDLLGDAVAVDVGVEISVREKLDAEPAEEMERVKIEKWLTWLRNQVAAQASKAP